MSQLSSLIFFRNRPLNNRMLLACSLLLLLPNWCQSKEPVEVAKSPCFREISWLQHFLLLTLTHYRYIELRHETVFCFVICSNKTMEKPQTFIRFRTQGSRKNYRYFYSMIFQNWKIVAWSSLKLNNNYTRIVQTISNLYKSNN